MQKKMMTSNNWWSFVQIGRFYTHKYKKWCGLLFIVLSSVLFACNGNKDELNTTLQGDNEPAFSKVYEIPGSPVSVDVSLSATNISIADNVVLTIIIRQEDEASANFPVFSDEALGGLTLQKTLELQDEVKDNALVVGREYVLAPLISETYTIPDFMVEFYTLDQLEKISEKEEKPSESQEKAEEDNLEEETTVQPHKIEITDLPSITVESVLPEETPELAPVKPAIKLDLPFRLKPWHYFLFGGIVLLLIAGLFIVYMIKYRKAKAPPPIPAHVIAFAALKKLRESNILENEGVQAFYYEISLILREYIERRFNIRAAEQTSEEFFIELSKSNIFSENQYNILKDFIHHCDLVKYALEEVDSERIQNTFTLVTSFIEQSAIKEAA